MPRLHALIRLCLQEKPKMIQQILGALVAVLSPMVVCDLYEAGEALFHLDDLDQQEN